MFKYIDAEKLIAKIAVLRKELPDAIEHLNDEESGFARGQQYELTAIEAEILSLQQEQPETVKGKFVFPKFLYARTLDNKTIDVSYGPQDMTAIEYVRNDFVEQTEADGDDGKFVKISVRKEFAEQFQKLGDEIQAGQSSFIGAMNQQEQLETVKGKFVFPKFLYARTLDNKTIDVSYGPQDMTAIEYVRNDFVEQQEVDLEKEIEMYISSKGLRDYAFLVPSIARHFYELGLRARKEESK